MKRLPGGVSNRRENLEKFQKATYETHEAQHAAVTKLATFYDNEIPAFVEEQLEHLYACLMTTVARFAIYDSAPNASTYVVRQGNTVQTLLLFRREHTYVKVYNEQMTLEAEEITQFVRLVFERYPTVKRVSFYAIRTDIKAIPYPFTIGECLEDIVVHLPRTEEEYLSRLSTSLRNDIIRRHKKILREYPSFRFELLTKDEVSETQIKDIIAFSEARMLGKNNSSYHTEKTSDQLIELIQHYGIVSVATIDGQICGGVIGQRIGKHYFAQIAAHSPVMDKFGLGILCNYLSVRAAIAAGLSMYHFGWGRYDYKYRLLGENIDLYRLEIFRSRLDQLRGIYHVYQTVRIERTRHLRRWLSGLKHNRNVSARYAVKLFEALRAIKRLFRTSE